MINVGKNVSKGISELKAETAINVKTYGAVGDGIQDDSDEIQAAVNFGISGSVIQLQKEKVYKISKTIYLKSGQTFDLNGSTILWDGRGWTSGNPYKAIISIENCRNTIVKNGKLDGNHTERTLGEGGLYCVLGACSVNCLIERVDMVGFGKLQVDENDKTHLGTAVLFAAVDEITNYQIPTIYTGDCTGNIVRECTFDSISAEFAVRFYTDFGGEQMEFECYDNVCEDCTIYNIGKSSCEIAGPFTHSCTFTRNHIVYARIDGCDIDKGAYNSTISYNTIDRVEDGDVDQNGGISIISTLADHTGALNLNKGNKVLYNVIKYASRQGIQMLGVTDAIVMGNRIEYAGVIGINSKDNNGVTTVYSVNSIISENVIVDAPTGISMAFGSRNKIVNNTILKSSLNGIILTSCTNVGVISNIIDHYPTPSSFSYGMYINGGTGINYSLNRLTINNTQNIGAATYFLSVTDTVCEGNTVTGNSNDYGIRYNNTCTNLVCSNNLIKNVTSPIIISSGSTGIICCGNSGRVFNSSTDATAIIQNNLGSYPKFGSATLDPTSLVDGDGVTLTITVSGATFGDYVQVSAPYSLQGLTLTTYVSSANTVSVRIQNESGATVDLSSGTWKVKVTQ